MTQHRPTGIVFDPAAITLQPSTLVVEASAGTGKTTNIANMTLRAIAEGFASIDQVLLVTFTVRAAAELRSRVHALLTASFDAVAARTLPPDHLLAPALARDPAGVQQRLGEAIGTFDRATISTIHGFAIRTLTELGVHADHDDFVSMGPPLTEFSTEIAEDLYLELARGDHRPGQGPPRLAATKLLVERSLEHPNATLTAASDADVRLHLARQARQRFEERKRARQVIFFNDTITRLRDALTHDEPGQLGNHAQEMLRRRYKLVTIEEFQDTDLDQWDLLREAFDGHALLLLIGDPKQSIYRFRGADVHAYLAASRDRSRHHLLSNYRSTAPLAEGVAAVLGGASLGCGIPTPPVKGVSTKALVDLPPDWASPAQLRVVRQALGPKTSPGRAFDHVCADLADHLATLFTSPDTRLVRRPHAVGEMAEESRRIQRRDVAILVRTSYRARQVSQALARVGIGTVGGASTGVVEGRAGRDWHQLLTTLVDVRPETVRRAALTSLVGWTLPQLVAADDSAIGELATSLRELSGVWAQHGMAVLADAVMSRFYVHERLLEQPQGAELLSDLAQVAELAHRRTLSDHLSADALLRWLADPPKDEVEHRLGSDEDLVQVMTIHGAKGLGFPIVCLPDLWYPPKPRVSQDEPRLGHGSTNTHGGLTLDVSARASRDPDQELEHEDLRLTYVALTRAQCSLRLWWAPSEATTSSPLHRLLSNQEPGALPRVAAKMTSSADLTGFLETLSAPRFSALSVTSVTADRPSTTVDSSTPPMGQPRRWTRHIDQHWRRTSYTGLTAALHDLPPDQPVIDLAESVGTTSDEPDLGEGQATGSAEVIPDDSAAREVVSPMADIPGGAEFGTLVHAILEHVDPQAPDLAGAIRQAVQPRLRGFGQEVDADQLVTALVGVFDTPLGALTGGTLRDLPASRRLAELDFEITMGSHELSRTVGDLAGLFADRSLLDADDPLAGYGAALQSTCAADGVLLGFLNGSIDAVLRVPPRSDGADERFVVVDYKTNTMPVAPGEVLTVGHYHAEAMSLAMQQAHYPLQALLYSVALHRYLGWSLPSYDPRRHLGGVGYLFVRGMAGPPTPVLGGMPAGVFTWRPRAEFILAANDVLGGRR